MPTHTVSYLTLRCISSHINCYRFSFFVNAPFLWNSLPSHTVNAESFASFKFLNFTNFNVYPVFCPSVHCFAYTCIHDYNIAYSGMYILYSFWLLSPCCCMFVFCAYFCVHVCLGEYVYRLYLLYNPFLWDKIT